MWIQIISQRTSQIKCKHMKHTMFIFGLPIICYYIFVFMDNDLFYVNNIFYADIVMWTFIFLCGQFNFIYGRLFIIMIHNILYVKKILLSLHCNTPTHQTDTISDKKYLIQFNFTPLGLYKIHRNLINFTKKIQLWII